MTQLEVLKIEKEKGELMGPFFYLYCSHFGLMDVSSLSQRDMHRPAACVPLTGSGVPICPVEGIKVEFCSVRHHSTDH